MYTTFSSSLSSIDTIRAINRSKIEISESLTRLASGKRINRASDDPSVVRSIDSLNAKIQSLSRATKNANQGQTFLSVAQDALKETSDLLLSLKELAVQALPESLLTSDRQKLSNEFASIVSQIEKISLATAYGANRLLNGGVQGKLFQIGQNTNDLMSITIGSANPSDIGAFKSIGSTRAALAAASSPSVNSTTASENIVVTANGLSTTIDVSAEDSALDVAAKINAIKSSTGVSADAVTYAELFSTSSSSETYTVKINGYTTSSFTISSSDVSDAVSKINLISSSTGASAVATSTNRVLLQDITGEDLTIENEAAGSNLDIQALRADATTIQGSAVSLDNGTTSANDSTRVMGTVTFSSHEGFSLTQSGDTSLGYASSGAATFNPLHESGLATANSARSAVETVSRAIDQITNRKGDISAQMARLESAEKSSLSLQDNLELGLQKIVDIDFARESARLAKELVLRQINTAILAQLNASASLVVDLLEY